MTELPELERAKLDAPLVSWYSDTARKPDDLVYVLIKCHLGTEESTEQLIERDGGILRGRGTLVRALRARVNYDTLGKLVRSNDVVGVEMVHRSSEFHISPYVAQSE